MDVYPETYKPGTFNTIFEEGESKNQMFAIGFKQKKKGMEMYGMLDGPTPDLDRLLETTGEEGYHILEYDAQDEAFHIYSWDDDEGVWKVISPLSRLSSVWRSLLFSEMKKTYFKNLVNKLQKRQDNGRVILPSGRKWFRALELTKFYQTRVVILGQDPYPKGDAMGLAFSVPDNIRNIPPSLRKIFKELKRDLSPRIKPESGNLIEWAERGVLLLNSTLTVTEGRTGSHKNLGWQKFTDKIISQLSKKRVNLVFMLWGKHAQAKSSLINEGKHLVLMADHPSPANVNGQFSGCGHFSKANKYFKKKGLSQINWRLQQ